MKTRTRRGLRIPDQNLWTGERRALPMAFRWDPAVEDIRLSYLDPADDDFEHGVLWVRHGQDRSGLYRWKAVNTPRTREMLRDHLCMVDSASCVGDDGRIWWLFVDDPASAPDGMPITNLPPTCPACIPESLKTCPRLIDRFRIVSVAATEPYAVTADLYMPSELDETPVKFAHEVNIPYGQGHDRLLRVALGKQPWVRLIDMRDEGAPP
ncbi:hypothetical protein [Nonomuraea endophytica]|uniref:hypothetical protein n=1 Tax=Nonomuraea endophytica TaxID=714136 RepID=UPI0037C79CB5